MAWLAIAWQVRDIMGHAPFGSIARNMPAEAVARGTASHRHVHWLAKRLGQAADLGDAGQTCETTAQVV